MSSRKVKKWSKAKSIMRLERYVDALRPFTPGTKEYKASNPSPPPGELYGDEQSTEVQL